MTLLITSINVHLDIKRERVVDFNKIQRRYRDLTMICELIRLITLPWSRAWATLGS